MTGAKTTVTQNTTGTDKIKDNLKTLLESGQPKPKPFKPHERIEDKIENFPYRTSEHGVHRIENLPMG